MLIDSNNIYIAMKTRHSGTVRIDYEADRARLEDRQVQTADTNKLMHYMIKASEEMTYREASAKKGTLCPLLKNHVLSVFAYIRRKRLAGYPRYNTARCNTSSSLMSCQIVMCCNYKSRSTTIFIQIA